MQLKAANTEEYHKENSGNKRIKGTSETQKCLYFLEKN